jgi:hypothetical protein
MDMFKGQFIDTANNASNKIIQNDFMNSTYISYMYQLVPDEDHSINRTDLPIIYEEGDDDFEDNSISKTVVYEASEDSHSEKN